MPPSTTTINGGGDQQRPRQPPQPPSTQPQNSHRPLHQQRHHHHPYCPAVASSSSSSSASLKGCCCCLFLLFSFLVLLVVAVVLVIILAVKPKKPQFDLQQVGVQYMGITSPNPTASVDPTATSTAASASASAALSLTIHMLFTAVNPNKVGIKYGESRFTVMYRGIPLGKASVPGFYQEAHSQRQVDATIIVDRYSLMQADAADLIRDATLNDKVELRVLGEVGAKIRVMGFDSPGVQVSVDCAIVISPRKQSLTYKQCGFDGVNL
uniref:Late embryogenesis abundant protein LEA-2 subgroup domain-containing protein n=1 Tax=Rhizophora mucronata TaxID=61149 RepID=A0A2P2IQT1_RHIMU